MTAVLLAACAPAASAADVQRAAVHAIFRDRAHDAAIVLWSDTAPGPVLEAIGERPAVPALSGAQSLGGVTVVRRHDLDTLFRAHPDGWRAFFAQHPGATGVVELSRVRYERGARAATIVVGRACGEHCRQAWRVRLRRVDDRWVTAGVDVVPVPGS